MTSWSLLSGGLNLAWLSMASLQCCVVAGFQLWKHCIRSKHYCSVCFQCKLTHSHLECCLNAADPLNPPLHPFSSCTPKNCIPACALPSSSLRPPPIAIPQSVSTPHCAPQPHPPNTRPHPACRPTNPYLEKPPTSMLRHLKHCARLVNTGCGGPRGGGGKMGGKRAGGRQRLLGVYQLNPSDPFWPKPPPPPPPTCPYSILVQFCQAHSS